MVDAPVLGTGAFGVRVRVSSRPYKKEDFNNPLFYCLFPFDYWRSAILQYSDKIPK